MIFLKIFHIANSSIKIATFKHFNIQEGENGYTVDSEPLYD